MAIFLCSCGNEHRTRAARAISGQVTSCGCIPARAIGERSRIHGHTSSPKRVGRHTKTYHAWSNMITRCENPSNRRHGTYGARGITVCPRWRNSFADFLADMGPAPDGLTLDRRDNDRGYEPDNCQWATRTEQARNKTTTKLNEVSVSLIRHMHRRGATMESLGHAFDVTSTTISYVVKRKTWK